MTKQIRLTALAVLGAVGLGLAAPTAAQAGSKGKRNTAIVLGAAALYGLVKKKPLVAGVAGAGAIYSYMQSRKDAKSERERDRFRRLSTLNDGRYYSQRGYSDSDRYRSRRSGDRSYRTRYARDWDDDRRSGPPGWSKGRKTGWGGRSMPPGQAKKWR